MIEQLIAFTLASLVVIVVPGPDMMLVLRNTARFGRTGAAWTAVGIMTGLAILASAAALGITALLAAAPVAFTVVKLAGGVYLIWLGVQAFRSYLRLRRLPRPAETALTAAAVERAPAPGARASSFRQGLLCNLLNPKVAAFYLSLFPQFDLAPLAPFAQHVVLAGAFWLLCLIWYVALISGISKVASRLQSPVFARRTEATAGVALTALGGLVLVRSA